MSHLEEKDDIASFKDFDEGPPTHVLLKEQNVSVDQVEVAAEPEYPDGGIGWLMAFNVSLESLPCIRWLPLNAKLFWMQGCLLNLST